MLSWSSAVLGVATVLLTLAYAVPQPWRLLRTRNGAGVSLAALTCSAVSTAAWIGYAVSIGDGWVLASSVVYAPCLAVTGWFAWRCGGDTGAPWLPAVFATVLSGSLLVDQLVGVQLFAVVLGVSTLWRVGPAAWAAWRTGDVSGVAAGAWWMSLLYGSVFLAYGLVAGVLASTVNALGCLLGAGLVLLRLAFDRFDLPGDEQLRRRWAAATA